MKKQLAGILALAMSLSMAACSSDSGSSGADGGNAASNETTTTAAADNAETTAKADDGDTEAAQNEEQETTVTEAEENYFEKALAMLPDEELKRENQEVQVVVCNSELPELAIQLFEEKYGGTVTVYTPSYNDRRYNITRLYTKADLYVSGSISDDFSWLVSSGCVLPVDEYVDLDSDMWSFLKDNKDYMEFFNFGGKRFVAVTDVSAYGYVCFYNKQTIKDHGLDDPWELYEAGKWNWDTMKSMLSEFADTENQRYGLEGRWYYPYALYRSAGVPMVGLSDGYLVYNFSDQTFLSTLDFGRELFNSGLLYSKYSDELSNHPELLGEGDLLFYIGFTESNDVENWSIKVSPEDIGVVPVPSPAGSDPYQSASAAGFALLSNLSENSQGRNLFAQCLALAYSDPAYIAEKEQNQKERYENSGLSDQIISQLNEINELAKQYPVIEYFYGTNNIYNTMNNRIANDPFYSAFLGDSVGSEFYDPYSTMVEEDNEAIKTYIESLG